MSLKYLNHLSHRKKISKSVSCLNKSDLVCVRVYVFMHTLLHKHTRPQKNEEGCIDANAMGAMGLSRNGILWRRYFHYHKKTLNLEGDNKLPLTGPHNDVALACFDSFCGIRWELLF